MIKADETMPRMKILIVGNSFFLGGSCFCGVQPNGLSKMLGNEATVLSNNLCDVSLYAPRFHDSHSWGPFLKSPAHKKAQLIRNLRFADVLSAPFLFFAPGQSLAERLRSIFYRLDRGCFIAFCRHINPDVIHFHSISESTWVYLRAAYSIGFKCALSLHGIISTPDVRCSKRQKRLEGKILKWCLDHKICVSVISHGIAAYLSKRYGISLDFFVIVPNGTSIGESPMVSFALPFDTKKRIVCYVGNVSRNKNQIAVLDALELLPSSVLRQTVFAFVGSDPHDCLRKAILAKKLESCCFVLGVRSEGHLAWLYSQSSLNLLLSKIEGFGLTIIEAMQFGIPSLFSDTNLARGELENQDCNKVCSLCSQDIANQILVCLQKKWDPEAIREFGRTFQLNHIAKLYFEFLRRSAT